jgi:hypothetical protein
MPDGPGIPERRCARVARVPACDVYPARPAVAGCRRCLGGDHEARCGYAPAVRRATPVRGLYRVVRAALAAYLVAVVGGSVAGDYVGAQFFSLAVPLLLGLGCGWAAARAAGRTRDWDVRLIAAVYAVVGAALAFRVNDEPFGSAGRWLPPLAAALAGALCGAYVEAPPPKDR